MERLYEKIGFSISSEEFCIKKFYEDNIDGLRQYIKKDISWMYAKSKSNHREKALLSWMGDQYNSDTLKELSTACSSDLLRVEGQPPPINVSSAKRSRRLQLRPKIPESTLQTLKARREPGRVHPQSLRYTSAIWLDHKPKEPDGTKLKPGECLVLLVRIYEPFKHRIGQPLRRVPAPSQDTFVLQMNNLAELRDKIRCSADNCISTEISDNPSKRIKQKAKDKYPSAMFYINNKFYIDTRNPKAIDYSKVLQDWAKTRKINVGETFEMEKTNFLDLHVRLGYPYLYQHQGDCEHLICFSDVRLLHESDPLHMSDYPVDRSIHRRYLPHCMCCSISLARWVSTENERVPHDPFFFCEECFISFNYKDGEKIGNFKAFPYVADEEFPE